MIFAAAGPFVRAEATVNPYLSIVERNPFAIKDPPPAPPVEAPRPVIPLAKVVLTGLTTIIGPPRALLEITETEPGKAPTVSKCVLKAGERDGSIEVLSIDLDSNRVRIKNGTIETNIGFEVVKQSAPGPAVPGTFPNPIATPTPPAPPAPVAPQAMTGGAASPMILSRGGMDAPGRANTGVTSYGAEVAPASSSTSYDNSSGYQVASANGSASIGNYGAASAVARPLRGDAAANADRPLSLEDNVRNFITQKQIADQNGGIIPHTAPVTPKKGRQAPPGGWILPPMPGFEDTTGPSPAPPR